MDDYRDNQICPSCGGGLEHNEDNEGETFQCWNIECQILYEAGDIIEGFDDLTPKEPRDE